MFNQNKIKTLIGLLVIFIAHNLMASDKQPAGENSRIYRQAFINIDHQKISGWQTAQRTDQIILPWFDGQHLNVTVEQVTRTGEYNTLFGHVKANFLGKAFLTMGENVLTGVIIKDGQSYRLRSMDNGFYSLTELDLSQVNYGDDAKFHRDHRPIVKQHDADYQHKMQKGTDKNTIDIVEYVNNGHDLAGKLYRTEDGSRIDILIAYTSEAAGWAQRNGLDIDAEIANMMDLTNKSLAYSGVQTFLHHVGSIEVNHTVMDPAEFDLDIEELTHGVSLQDLRLQRGLIKADLVSLLVFNGEYGCTSENNLACGVGWVPPDFMQPIDFKEYGFGEQSFLFGRDGFSVVNIFNAFNGYVFMHEIGHNLGAHHDVYRHYTAQEADTVDEFARGWVMLDTRMTTLMAYHDLCKQLGITCQQIPFYSNPLNSYVGGVNGDPVPGQSPNIFFGPADNVSAMNRMKRTVANYKRKFLGS